MSPKRSSKPTAVGAFIFAGGFTLGVRQHFDVLAHFEQGSFGVRTAKHNMPDLDIYPDHWPTQDYKDRVDFIYANPPCAPWSRSNIRVGNSDQKGYWESDNRVACVEAVFGLLKTVRPKVWAWESVRGAFTFGRSFVDSLTTKALRAGYSVTYLYVDGRRHGVAQRRPRFFMVIHNVQLDFPLPDNPPVTVRKALKGVKPVVIGKLNSKALFTELIPDIPPGAAVRPVFDKLYAKHVADSRKRGVNIAGRPSFLVRRAPWDGICYTLTGGCHMLHPEANRYMSVEECAALCGYPRDFEFTGPVTTRYAEVAKAVMPPVGEYLARHVARGLKKGAPAQGQVRFIDVSGAEYHEHLVER